jgi:hypothetical protein
VLLLSNGFMQAGGRTFAARPAMPADGAPFGSPTRFVPQKTIAKQRLKVATAAAAVVALLATIACLAAG